MFEFTQGNLLEADAEALVNTVNEVGVMGKGIALMFKEAYPDNFRRYAAACKAKDVKVGRVFVTERHDLMGPRWIVNFPTKKHWRHRTRMEWIVEGLDDLRQFIEEKKIQSIAIPPLGSGNGGLDWQHVKERILTQLGDLQDVRIIIYEPTSKYQNVAKRSGVKKLTPARALIAEMVRRYSLLGFDCTILEIQKLAWFLERSIDHLGLPDPLDLRFEAGIYGPYATRLTHLLDSLDGSYLHCDRRIPDARPFDAIRFDSRQKDKLLAYLKSGEAKAYLDALEYATDLIDGFESPLGLELLATVDWLLLKGQGAPTLEGVRGGLSTWPGGAGAGERKQSIFSDRQLDVALRRVRAKVAA